MLREELIGFIAQKYQSDERNRKLLWRYWQKRWKFLYDYAIVRLSGRVHVFASAGI